MSLKVAGADGDTSLGQVLAALEWVRVNRNAHGLNICVVNLALGVEDRGGYQRDVLAWAVERLWQSGIVVVAAGWTSDPYVIAAGASDTPDTVAPADDRVADFSSRSRWRSPDVVAPGARVVSLRVLGSALDQEYGRPRRDALLPRQRHVAGRCRRVGCCRPAALGSAGAGARPGQGPAHRRRGRPARSARGGRRGARGPGSVAGGARAGCRVGAERAVLEMVVQLGAMFGLQVVAQGIEREDQREALASLGCELGQGCLIGRPLPLGATVPA